MGGIIRLHLLRSTTRRACVIWVWIIGTHWATWTSWSRTTAYWTQWGLNSANERIYVFNEGKQTE